MELNEDSPLVDNPRNALRGSVARVVMSVSENSKLYIYTKIFFSIIKLSVCFFIIMNYETSADKPLLAFVYMIISVEIVDTLCFLYFLSVDPPNRGTLTKDIISFFKNASSL